MQNDRVCTLMCSLKRVHWRHWKEFPLTTFRTGKNQILHPSTIFLLLPFFVSRVAWHPLEIFLQSGESIVFPYCLQPGVLLFLCPHPIFWELILRMQYLN